MTQIKVLSYSMQIPEGMTLDSLPNMDTDEKVIGIIKDRKQNKLFSKQDRLGLLAAHNAWEKSDIKNIDPDFSNNTGIYFCVGTLPFEDRPLEKLAGHSQVDGKLDYKEFSTTGFNALNPMLTFKALPNMPLFHISYNLEITGRYFMTYPGVMDWFSALKRAIDDLNEGLIEYAIVGASCDQKNFLVKHHIKRTQNEYVENAIDCSAAIVITKKELPHIGVIDSIEQTYDSFNPFEQKIILSKNNNLPAFCGPVSPLIEIGLKLKDSDQELIEYKWEGNQEQNALLKIRRML